jgi:predicted transcriptional regulator
MHSDFIKESYTLDSITLLIRDEIKRQYKSVKKFSDASGIPYSTLSNALAKGIGGTSYDTVLKICKLLNLKQVYDADLTIFNDRFYEICSMLSELDEQGVHTVKTVLTIEHNRCTKHESDSTVKPFNGISYAGKTFQTNEDK